MSTNTSNGVLPGPYTPTLILHGGAGSISRSRLPPTLYHQYQSSLLTYLTSTRSLLFNGGNALRAAVHAVSLMEDDPLFNCGHGAVFTEKGTIEMEASVMVASVRPDAASQPMEKNGGISPEAFVKRGAGVILVTETKHPIRLAEQMLLHTRKGEEGGSMHCQLSGKDLEETGFREWGMEKMPKDYFWTKKRWEEHLRGLGKSDTNARAKDHVGDAEGGDGDEIGDGYALPSQGTVGCVCMDAWGNIAVATSTGGLTNKKSGRIGDTPTLGAGFWAESWDEEEPQRLGSIYEQLVERQSIVGRTERRPFASVVYDTFQADIRNITSCIPFANSILDRLGSSSRPSSSVKRVSANLNHVPITISNQPLLSPQKMELQEKRRPKPLKFRRAIAVSGTGNGDSFLRIGAARTVGARCRYGHAPSLAASLSAVVGKDGELQQSAGDRWGNGEGEGGIIGIELMSGLVEEIEQDAFFSEGKRKLRGRVVWDFNCGGMWRAFWDESIDKGKVMVFRGEYEDEQM